MLLEIRDLSVAYGKAVALENVSLRVAEGEFVAVLGPNCAASRCSATRRTRWSERAFATARRDGGCSRSSRRSRT